MDPQTPPTPAEATAPPAAPSPAAAPEPTPQAPPPARAPLSVEAIVFRAGAAAIGALYLWHAFQYGDYIAEDSAITFAYAKNWVSGIGLTVNPGDPPVEGYSNPTWMFVCAIFLKLGLFHEVWTPKIVGALLTLGTGALAAGSVRKLAPAAPAWISLAAPLFLATNVSFVFWSVGGLENALYAFLIALTGFLFLRDIENPGRIPLSGLAAVGVALSRPEGLMYVIALAGAAAAWLWYKRDWRWLAALLVSMAVPITLYILWHNSIFPSLVPNTFYAKSGKGGWTLWQRVTDFTTPGWKYVFAAAADGKFVWLLGASLGGLVARQPLQRGFVYWWLALPASVFFVLSANGDWMVQYRLLSPFYVILAVTGAAGLAALLDRVPHTARAAVAGVVTLAAFGGALYSATGLPEVSERTRAKPSIAISWTRGMQGDIVRALDQFKVPPEEALVLISDIGMPAYLANGRYSMIDMFGLTDPTVAKFIHENGDIQELWKYAFDVKRPQLLQVANPTGGLWRLHEHPTFLKEYASLQHPPPDKVVGLFIRRDLYQLPYSPAQTEQTVIQSGSAYIHALEFAPAPDGTLNLTIQFSVTDVSEAVPRADLEILGNGSMQLSVPLWENLPAHLLEPGAVYLSRQNVKSPPSLAPLQTARALGPEVPSPVAAPSIPKELLPIERPPLALVWDMDAPGGKNGAPKGMEFNVGPKVTATIAMLQWPEGLRGVRMDATQGGLTQLCTDPVPYAAKFRVISRVRVESIGQKEGEWKILNLFARTPTFPATTVEIFRTPGPHWRVIDKVYQHKGPEGEPITFCYDFTYSSGVVEVDELIVAPVEGS